MGVVRIGLICGRMGRYISVIVGLISYFEVMRFDASFFLTSAIFSGLPKHVH